ncbi:MAG: polysaccharide deacetylase family protein [Pseudomonadota bacterium]
MKLKHHARYDYAPIHERPDFSWPEGRRLAVYLGLNLEHFAFGEGLGAELAPGGPQPDLLNYAWRDYGNRVGAWRMLALFDELDLPSSVLVNTALYDYCTELVAAFAARGDEIVGHGRTNSERQSVLEEDAERALIAECSVRIEKEHGSKPAGWLSPWIAESHQTPDLLAETGYTYTLNWCMDDQPVWMRTRGGPLLSVPYPQELNDIPAVVARKVGAVEFADMIIDQFDEMRAQSKAQPLVMGIALHPYIVGQPIRLRQLRRALEHIHASGDVVWITRAGTIAAHFAGLFPPPADTR